MGLAELDNALIRMPLSAPTLTHRGHLTSPLAVVSHTVLHHMPSHSKAPR